MRYEVLELTGRGGRGDNESGVEGENVDNGDSGVILEVFETFRSSVVVSRLTVDRRAVSVLGRKLFGVLIRNAARPFVADTD